MKSFNNNISYFKNDDLNNENNNNPISNSIFSKDDPNEFYVDNFLNTVGYNLFHFTQFMVVTLIFFIEGCEMIVVNLMLPTIARQWNISQFKRIMISSSIFIGYFVGSLLSGFLTNKYGRSKSIKYASLAVMISSLMTALTPNIIVIFFFIRLSTGISIGVIIPSSITLVAESIPTKFRSLILNNLLMLFPIGVIYICIVAIIFTKGVEFEWRKIFFVNCLNSILMSIFTLLLYESPRFLYNSNKFKELIDVLEIIGFGSNIVLTLDEKNEIKRICLIKLEENKEKSNESFTGSGLSKLLNPRENLKLSLILSFLWFSSSFISLGLFYILPRIIQNFEFENRTESLKHIIFTMVIVFPCPMLRGLISEIKFIGRKKAIVLGFTASLITSIMCLVSSQKLILYSSFLKVFMNISIGVISVYTAEVYDTNIRSISLGFGCGIARLAGLCTPYLCDVIDNLIFRGTFFIFALFSFISIILTLCLPYETVGQPLDRELIEHK